MGYTEEFNLDEISKGRKLRRVPVHLDEYFEVGDFHPEVGGWELRPYGKNIYRWDGILLYIRPENLKGRFELLKGDDK
jgi:hypothetical protein